MKNLYTLALTFIVAVSGWAQTTIVNYDFNSSPTLPYSCPNTASNITASINGTEANAAFGGVQSGGGAFTANTTAGTSLSMANNTNTNSWTLSLSGSDLNKYINYKLYFQTQRSTTGAQTITISYSTNGSTYINLSQTASPADGSFAEYITDLSSISQINNATALYLKFTPSGATSTTGTLRIDNLEIQAAISPWTVSGGNVTFTGGVTAANFNTTGTIVGGATTLGSLNVTGNSILTGTLRNTNLAGTGSRIIQTDASGNISALSGGTSSQVLYGNNTWGALPATTFLLNGSNAYFSSGKVGIGNNAPNSTLDVTGSINATTNLSAGGNVIFSGLTTEPVGTTVQNLKIDANGNLYKQANGVSAVGTVGNWDLQGNGQTSESLNFLGTTDDEDLVIKTNGTERMRITSHHSNNKEEGRVYIGGGDLITTANDLPGNWDDKLVIKDALRVVNDNLSPSKCALLGNDGANTYLESFSINPPDQPGSPWYNSPDGILMGWYSGANVYVGFSGSSSNSGNLYVQQNIWANNKVGIGTSTPSARLSIVAPTSGDIFNIDGTSGSLFKIANDGTTLINSPSTSNPSFMIKNSSGTPFTVGSNGYVTVNSDPAITTTAHLQVDVADQAPPFLIINRNNGTALNLFGVTGNGSTYILDGNTTDNNPLLTMTHSNGSTLQFMGNGVGDIVSSGGLRPYFASGDFTVFEGAPGSGTARLQIASGGAVTIPGLIATTGVSSTGPYQPVLIDANGKLVSGPQVVTGTSGLSWSLGGNASSGATLGTIDANSDLPIIAGNAEAIRILSTPASGSINGNVVLNNQGVNNTQLTTQLILKTYGGSAADAHHGLGYFNNYTNNIGTSVHIDGPVLYGYTGGALGTNQNSGTTIATNIALQWDNSGKIYIGSQRIVSGPHQDALLQVSGKIACQEVRVFTNSTGTYWADYVFNNNYKLLPIEKVEDYYLKNKHLPGVPSEKEISEQGNDLAKTDAILLSKIEENTIYIVELNKKLEKLAQENEELKTLVKKLLNK